MSKLPISEEKRQFDFLNKPIPNPSDLIKAQLVANRSHLKLPKKLIAFLLTLVVILVAVYVGFTFVYPQLTKKKPQDQAVIKPFEYPVNVAEIKYPSDFLKNEFLTNLQLASKEPDKSKNYKYLENDFVYLLGFYTSTHSYDLRVQLDKFKEYMKKNYPDQYQKSLVLYEYTCMDKLCAGATEAKKPVEIEAIINEVQGNSEINKDLKDGIMRNLDQAIMEKNKNAQANVYVGLLSSLFSEYQKTKNVGIKNVYFKLSDFIKNNYPEAVVSVKIKIES